MASPWDRLGRVASVMQLTGVDAMGLVSMIVQAANIARRNREQCQQLAQHVQIVGNLLRKLQIPELRRHPETRLPLDQLNDALLRAFMLVRSCSQQQEKTSRVYQMLTGDDVANKLRRAQEEIDRYITLIPMITTVAVICARGTNQELAQDDTANGTHQESAQDDTANDATLAQRPSLSLQEVTELLALEEPPPTGTLAVNQPPTIVLGDIVKDLLSRPGRSNIWFGPARTIMRLTEIGATHKEGQHVSGQPLLSDFVKEFTFAQLDAATKGFAAEAKIGEGSFGTVYRGEIPDEREVAIKRGFSGVRTESAFRSELACILYLRQKHVVRLVGYCMEKDERLLVYEYMKNGALYDHLHPKLPASPPSPVASSWELRIQILRDASYGILYLHWSAIMSHIVHCNIKSSNILLDGGWRAHVSDIALVPMEPEGPVSVVNAATLRYGYPNALTMNNDVYNFGVVMLEVLTGKRAIFDEADGESPVSVVDYAVPSIVAGDLAKVLDPRAPEPTAAEAVALELVASAALQCIRVEAKEHRPMVRIGEILDKAVTLCACSDRGDGEQRLRSGPSLLDSTVFTLAQLKKATRGFALEAMMNEGSLGKVLYRGELDDGREVAIKRIKSRPQLLDTKLQALGFIAGLHHNHLVRLVGYCMEEGEFLLVYDYMKNGSLYDQLHRRRELGSPVASSWKLRIKILLDASRGIQYLPIVHGDIKASNILLDSRWSARVSDSGQWQMVETTRTGHYNLSRRPTAKDDVYGFGEVMLQVLTGRLPPFNQITVRRLTSATIATGVLCEMLDSCAPEPDAHEVEALKIVASTAAQCVQVLGKDRPEIADIVASLETAVALCDGGASGA